MALKTLLSLGLSELEAKTYLCLLENGEMRAGGLAQKAGINRTTTYQLLQSLVSKGFASYCVKEGVKYFDAVEPETLLDLVEEKRHSLTESLDYFNSLRKHGGAEAKVTVFKGKEGYKSCLRQMLHLGRVLYAIGYTGKMQQIDPVFYERWTRERLKRGIRRKYIMTRDAAALDASKKPLTEIRTLPKEYHYFPFAIVISGNKSLIFFFDGDDFTGIAIDSEGIAKSYMNFFKFLWKKASPVKH